jgi:hypothetical protein
MHDVGVMGDDGYGDDGNTVFDVSTYVNTISPQACGIIRWTQRRNGILRLTPDEPYVKAVIGYYATAKAFGGSDRVPYFSIVSAAVKRVVAWNQAEGDNGESTRLMCMIRMRGLMQTRIDVIVACVLDEAATAVAYLTSIEVAEVSGEYDTGESKAVRKFSDDSMADRAVAGAPMRSSGRSRSGSGTLPGIMFTPELFRTIKIPKMPGGLFCTRNNRRCTTMIWNALRQLAEDDWSDYQMVLRAFTTEYRPKLEACMVRSTPALVS